MTGKPWRPDWTIPPGEILHEILTERGLSLNWTAEQLDLTQVELRNLLIGELELTADLATKIARVTSTSRQVWINLETDYRETSARLKAEGKMS